MSAAGYRFEARDLAAQLGERIGSLAPQLLPRGIYSQGRRHWRVGSVNGEPGQSLCAWLDGPKRGRWRDYAAGEGGDALDLVAVVLCHGDKGAACKWAIDWLGLGRLDPQDVERLRRKSEKAREQRARQAEHDAEANARDAKLVWLAGQPLRSGDAGWRYLAGRGIDLALLPAPPAALRLHPGLWNGESRRHWPALVAAICGPDGRHVNTHRIWLDPHSNGEVKKAPLDRPKLSMLGGYSGGCVRLWKGASGRPWNTMPDGETLAIGEGIEDVLTIVCAQPEWRAAAVLSVSSLAPLVLPLKVNRLIWIAQNDPRRSPAATALAEALRVHRAAGRRVSTIRPPPFVKDVAELAQLLAATPDPNSEEAP